MQVNTKQKYFKVRKRLFRSFRSKIWRCRSLRRPRFSITWQYSLLSTYIFPVKWLFP